MSSSGPGLQTDGPSWDALSQPVHLPAPPAGQRRGGSSRAQLCSSVPWGSGPQRAESRALAFWPLKCLWSGAMGGRTCALDASVHTSGWFSCPSPLGRKPCHYARVTGEATGAARLNDPLTGMQEWESQARVRALLGSCLPADPCCIPGWAGAAALPPLSNLESQCFAQTGIYLVRINSLNVTGSP